MIAIKFVKRDGANIFYREENPEDLSVIFFRIL